MSDLSIGANRAYLAAQSNTSVSNTKPVTTEVVAANGNNLETTVNISETARQKLQSEQSSQVSPGDLSVSLMHNGTGGRPETP